MATGTRPRDWADVDYYAILGVTEDADDDTVARAFRALAKQLHPDAGAEPVDVERFKDVAGAYEVLGNPARRRDYDRVRRELAWRRAERLRRGTAGPSPAAPPAFAAAKRRARGLTRRRALIATGAGVATFVAGVGVAVLTVNLHNDDARLREGTIAVNVAHTEVDGEPYITFRTETGERVTVPAPDFGEQGRTDVVRYRRDDPRQVTVEEDTAGRDITLAIVALKMLVGGPVLSAFGFRRLRARTTGVR